MEESILTINMWARSESLAKQYCKEYESRKWWKYNYRKNRFGWFEVFKVWIIKFEQISMF